MDKKRILITGATGFIGNYLSNHYKDQYEVLSPGRSLLDLTNEDSVNDFFNIHTVDYVIHCALIGRNNLTGVDDSILVQNLKMFQNLWANKHKFKKLINMGTGNEFDTRTLIDRNTESILYDRMPKASYGLTKNLIARIISDTDHFYNLRLFGIFHNTELPTRFFQKFKITNEVQITQDMYFDFFNLDDLPVVIDAVLNDVITDRDINVCYSEKYKLSEYALKFANINNIDIKNIKVVQTTPNSFTGSNEALLKYNLAFQGIDAGFKKYI